MNDLLQINGLSQSQKAERLLKLADLKKQVETAYNALRDELLEETQRLGVLTLKTESYTITRARRVTPQVVDYKQLKETLEKEKIPYTVKEVFGDAMTEVFKQAIKEGRELEGLESKITEYITIRGGSNASNNS